MGRKASEKTKEKMIYDKTLRIFVYPKHLLPSHGTYTWYLNIEMHIKIEKYNIANTQ